MILQDWADLLKIDSRKLNWHLKKRTITEAIQFFKDKGVIE